MHHILHNLLMCSVTGGIMFILSIAARPLMQKKSMAKWFCLLLNTSLAMFILPFQYLFDKAPKMFSLKMPVSESGDVIYNIGTPVTLRQINLTPIKIIFIIWAAAAAVLCVKNILAYILTAVKLNGIVSECDDKTVRRRFEEMCVSMNIRRNISLKKGYGIKSPVLFGVIKPMVVIPERRFTESELKMIFAHELTHYKHHDTAIKLLCVLAGCIHWFNPSVYFLKKVINSACELYCDESVLEILCLKDKKDYGRLLISVIEESGSRMNVYSTSMAASKKHIKNRLSKILEFKTATKLIKTAGILTLISMSVCSLTAFGFTYAAKIAPEEIAPIFSGNEITEIPEPIQYMPENAEDEIPDEPETAEEIIPDTPEETGVDLQDSILAESEEINAPEPSIEVYILSEADRADREDKSPELTPAPEPQEIADLPEVPEVPAGVKSGGINIPAETTGYMFSADFSGGTEAVRSDIIHATDDVRISIKTHNTRVAVFNAETSGDKAVFNDKEFDNYNIIGTFHMYIDLEKGSDYYITAYYDDTIDESEKSFISINTVD